MSGKSVPYDQTYLTPPVIYRQDVSQADPSPLVDGNGNAVPDIRLDINSSVLCYQAANDNTDTSPANATTERAYNAHLELYVHFDPDAACQASHEGIIDGLLNVNDVRCHADIRVWAWSGPSGNSSIGRWCLTHEQSVVTDTLITLRNVPNTKYRVTVAALQGESVTIIEQHTT